jgi:hypothetical protein
MNTDIKKIEIDTDYGSWFWFIFITVIFLLIWRGLVSSIDIAEINKNWPKYRCSPGIMPFASMYGYDTSENFNYCLQNIFKTQMGEATGPFNTILGTMIVSMMTFLQNLNSLRIMLATLLGGITRVFQEFTDRFKTFMSQVQTSSLRLQMLMKRVFGTFYAVIYMGMSVIQTGKNFSETFIFKFIDTFCFAPETLVHVRGKGKIPISEVVLHDTLIGNKDTIKSTRVTSVYKFVTDGQPMVRLGSVIVSTNHFLLHNGAWIQAKEHPDAVPIESWNGGVSRPLICLDTDTHKIPIDNYTFSDWDETSDSDTAVMNLAEKSLNGIDSKTVSNWLYQPALDGEFLIRLADGSTKYLKDLILGETLSTGRIIGLGKRIVHQICKIRCMKTHESKHRISVYSVTPSQLIWHSNKWCRAGHIYPVETVTKELYTILVMNSATIETDFGSIFRDMLEVHSPDMELPTMKAIQLSNDTM